ncbi:MAG: GNAT family N-acetyltransferase [Candidatus Thorarchaeota archaeon]|nr:MAG: GNAT family N-acetyltransferase [Candidatus Thorarchaeota archaeon]
MIEVEDSRELGQTGLISTLMKVRIREARLDDAPAIHDTLKEAMRHLAITGYSEAAVEAAIVRPWVIRDRILSGFTTLVAEADGTIVGAVGGIRESRSMRVVSLAVRPSHQRRGIGCRLLLKLESIATRLRCHKLFLFTAWSMMEAIRLYLSLGYRKEGYLRRHFHGEDMAIFSKYLFKEGD